MCHILKLQHYEIQHFKIPPCIRGRRRFLNIRDVLPAGYTRLEYLESSGSQYIDTRFCPNQDTRVICEFQYLSTNTSVGRCLYGSRDDANNTNEYSFGTNKSSQFVTNVGTGNKTFTNSDITGIHTVDSYGGVIKLDDEVVTCDISVNGSYSIHIFDINQADDIEYRRPADARVYSFKIYDNGVLVRDFVPCVDNEGIYGMGDVITREFYCLYSSVINNIYISSTMFNNSPRIRMESTYQVSSDVVLDVYCTDIDDYLLTSSGVFEGAQYDIVLNKDDTLNDNGTSFGKWENVGVSIMRSKIRDDKYTYTFTTSSPFRFIDKVVTLRVSKSGNYFKITLSEPLTSGINVSLITHDVSDTYLYYYIEAGKTSFVSEDNHFNYNGYIESVTMPDGVFVSWYPNNKTF